jgi:pimeloyl-ACP methyl ester carboxylesterase
MSVLVAGPATASGDIVDKRVHFSVVNSNNSEVPCSSDGAAYTIAGRLVAPRSVLNHSPRAITLYLHGLGYGKFFWHFTSVPGYNYARHQAHAGHASLIIDRLGYDRSDHPPGAATCIGAQADIAHQVVSALRSGGYSIESGRSRKFADVALAGHSLGGLVAQVEAYSFTDVDALIIMSFADQGSSQTAITEFLKTGAVCASGGQPAEPGEPSGYAFFGQTNADFQAAMFHNASARVVDAATARRNRDPCGDTSSVIQSLIVDQAGLPEISAPVLIVCGDHDALFPPPACDQHKGKFTGSDDVTESLLDDTGHAVTLERTRRTLESTVGNWLNARGF